MKITLILILSILLTANDIAQWGTHFKDDLQLTDWSRLPLAAASDGDGGVYFAIDYPQAPIDTILGFYSYLFKLDKYGYTEWNNPIKLGIGDWQNQLELIEDGEGGVIAVIGDLDYIDREGITFRYNYNIRLQRVDKNGYQMWEDGILVADDSTDQFHFEVCKDDSGGVFVSWLADYNWDDVFNDGYRAIQHINSKGERSWPDTGLVLYRGDIHNYDHKWWHQIVTNGNGGLYTISTSDLFNFQYINIDRSANIIWEQSSRFPQKPKEIFSSPLGDLAAFTWDSSYYMERFDDEGNYNWEEYISIGDSLGERSSIIDVYFNSDSSTSIYWRNHRQRPYFEYSSYYQVINSSGEKLLPYRGIEPIDSTFGSRMFPSEDDYLCITGNYVQKMTKEGNRLWDSAGVTLTLRQADYDSFVMDTRGGFIKVWIEGLYGSWAKQVSSNGNIGEVITKIDRSKNWLPKGYELYQNYPNPFNPTTTIKYGLPTESQIRIDIYNLLGEEFKVLHNGIQSAGYHNLQFDASNLSSGIYLYRISATSLETRKEFQSVKKMVLIK